MYYFRGIKWPFVANTVVFMYTFDVETVGSLEPAIPTFSDPQRTRRKREEKGSRDVVKTTLYYITRRGFKGPCRVTVGRPPRLTDKKKSLRCGSFQ
ncbi:hypothetical protein AVEN_231584-1 [Araneus ventricosus]|uniref:Uncharacterized protein n=1 Tax=Araneus ventricosus TaxID=182803 RepID=A0A4Y2IJN2_ARAVE|nr:hypothetical protein AVEN_231584-1 [Araneus ventricosus]